MEATPLLFTRYSLDEVGSASVFFHGKKQAELTGIYILEFGNGQRYVGKTTNIVSRLAAHRRRHDDVAAFHFAAAMPRDLDRLERAVIAVQEQKFSLRNISLTELPGGLDALAVQVAEVEQILLPWERERRETVARQASSRRRRHWQLTRRDDYGELLDVLATYVQETVPDPVATAQHLWNITALPETGRRRGRRRLFTLNCGGLETLFCVEWEHEGEGGIDVLLNIKDDPALAPLGEQLFDEDVLSEVYEPHYRQAQGVVTLCVPGWAEAARLLEYTELLDAAYRLNVELMRRGTSIFRRHHNSSLAEAVLTRIGQRELP